LPLVFLAYAVIGFVARIELCSFRGVLTTSDPAMTKKKNHFDDYTKWTVVGALGSLAECINFLEVFKEYPGMSYIPTGL